jgi:hypothetical protein
MKAESLSGSSTRNEGGTYIARFVIRGSKKARTITIGKTNEPANGRPQSLTASH